jgi:hypothetical protein
VLAFHSFVHHKIQRYGRAFAGPKGHRTDGRDGRSAPLLDFDVGGFCEAQGAVAFVGKGERHVGVAAQTLVAQIDEFSIDLNFWGTAGYISIDGCGC